MEICRGGYRHQGGHKRYAEHCATGGGRTVAVDEAGQDPVALHATILTTIVGIRTFAHRIAVLYGLNSNNVTTGP
jgi:hypothetical protein